MRCRWIRQGCIISSAPQVLRRHQPPDPELVEAAVKELASHGITVNASTSAQLHASLDRLRATLDPTILPLVVTSLTKPMKTAEYLCSGACPPQSGRCSHASSQASRRFSSSHVASRAATC